MADYDLIGKLAENSIFRRRVSVAIVRAALDILNNSGGETAERINWAKEATASYEAPAVKAGQMIWFLLRTSPIFIKLEASDDAEIQNAVNGNIPRVI